MCPKFNQFIGIWSLDWMALDQNTRSKVFVNFGSRSNAIFGTRLKPLLSENSKKIQSTENKTFDLVKKDNFDQVKFHIPTPFLLIFLFL